MTVTNRFSHLTIAGLLLSIILACNSSVSPSAVTEPARVKTSVPPTVRPQNPPALPPTQKLPNVPTKLPTKKPTVIPSNTPLPPMPDFDEVITFAPGAGGGPCSEIDQSPNYLDVWINSNSVHLIACFWLVGVDVSRPVEVTISPIVGTSDAEFRSPRLFLDPGSGRIQGEGFPSENYFGWWGWQNESIVKGHFNVWMTGRLAVGEWRFTVRQDENSFAVSSDFKVERGAQTFVNVIGSRFHSELVPGSSPFNIYRLVKPKSNGNVDVTGNDFPPNTPIYVLSYRNQENSNEMELMRKQVTQSNNQGTIATEVVGPFVSGQYILICLADPNLPLEVSGENNYHNFNWELPFDAFEVEKQNSSSSIPNSCPGAPPQRMIINQRGYVCTKSDRVRLRNAPAKSADTIVYANTGTQFTVIGGPSCADNWSWWNVRLDDGTTGWLAEGGDDVDPYFICPMP